MQKETIINLIKEEISDGMLGNIMSANYSFITMNTSYFIDISEVRYDNNINMGIEIQGFKKVLNAVRNFSEANILMTSFTNETMDLGVYTNESGTFLIGIIDFKSVNRTSKG